MVSQWVTQLQEKISSRNAVVGIIGLGYVGAPLAELINKKGFTVIGFERNEKRRKEITQRLPHMQIALNNRELETCDIIVICIQTPIHEDKTPNLDFLLLACAQVAKHLRKGQMITIESSIHPGVTRNIVLPILQKKNMHVGNDFFLAFSPERIDPGNATFFLENIPKIVSGADVHSLELIAAFYKKIFTSIIPVSSLETAEMVKIFENTFRLINISLVNEIKEYTDTIGVDMWEVVKAASTKPFGFMPHYPGPGIGGHCIPVDPFYLFDDAKKRGIILQFIQRAGEINDTIPSKVVGHALEIMHSKQAQKQSVVSIEGQGTDGFIHPLRQVRLYTKQITAHENGYKGLKGGMHTMAQASQDAPYRILLIGISYKPNVDDLRESPAIKIWELFEKYGHHVSYHDPYIPEARGVLSVPLSKDTLSGHDMYVIVTNHANIDYPYLASFGKPIIDTRHAYEQQLPNIYYV